VISAIIARFFKWPVKTLAGKWIRIWRAIICECIQ
jgi:hypothetical protein